MRSQTTPKIVFTLLFIYLSTFGATFNGILIPELRWMTLLLLAGFGIVWFMGHYRARWQWHRTPLDLSLILWGVVIMASFFVNGDVWHRSIIAIWFVLGYMVVWYMLSDWIGNGGMTKETLIEACLFGGMVIVFFGYVQFLTALGRGEFVRVGSLVGNPNSLGAFLLFLLTFIIGRWLMVKNRLARLLLVIYALSTGSLLAITFSRGAWIGMAGSLSVLGFLWLSQQGMTIKTVLSRWRSSNRAFKLTIVSVGITTLFILVGGVWAVVQSLDAEGRSVGLRTDIYGVAWQIFEQHPITGTGLFTFGREFATYQSQPPRQPHSHPHNGVLIVLSELGILGMVALIVASGTAFWIMRRNWQVADARERGVLMIGIAGAIGFGIHHLLDFPAMMPLIALCGLLPLLIATLPQTPVPLTSRWRVMGHPIAMGVLLIGLVTTGAWRTMAYGNYTAIVASPFASDTTTTYLLAAQALDAVIASDPFMPLYHQQQGYLYGLAVWDGDRSALPSGISAYERFLAYEPNHAISWVNLGHLYWQADMFENAVDAQRRAVALAPDSFPFHFILANYLESQGDSASAEVHYRQALSESTALWTLWDFSPLRRQVFVEFELSDSHQLILALANNIASADWDALWRASDYADENSTRARILWFMVVLRQGDSIDGETILTEAKRLAKNRVDEAWILLGEAKIAQSIGQFLLAEERLMFARNQIAFELRFNQEDIVFATNVPYFQFLSTAIPRQLLPQVFYPIADVALMRLLD